MSYEEIQNEWDSIAYERLLDLRGGQDLSYELILKPNVISAILRYKHNDVLDAGCGVGVLTHEISLTVENVTAIDISGESIRLAKEYCSNTNINYFQASIESYNENSGFDIIVSNMVLMDAPNIKDIVSNVYSLLRTNGVFIFTITHPVFWPLYWGYSNQKDFNYNQETEIRKEFSTRAKKYDGFYTRHFHRPLEYYINTLINSGLLLKKYTELRDVASNLHWYPRFILFECVKV